jgi:hypothetical protein
LKREFGKTENAHRLSERIPQKAQAKACRFSAGFFAKAALCAGFVGIAATLEKGAAN